MNKLPVKRKVSQKVGDKNLKSQQTWKGNPAMEKDFIILCLESASLHKYQGSSLKNWTHVIERLNAKYSTTFDQKALKNKYDALKKGYSVWRKLIFKTGNGRNEDGSFNWPPEMWEAEIEKDPNVAKFRYKPLPHFKELEDLFEGVYAVGDDNINLADDDSDADGVDTMNEDIAADILEGDRCIDLESDAYFSATRDVSPGLPRQEVSPGVMSTPSSNKAQKEKDSKRKRATGELADITEILRTKFEKDEEVARQASKYSWAECSKILNAMKLLLEVQLDKRVYYNAKVKLCSSSDMRMAFMDEETIAEKVMFLEALGSTL